MPRIVSKRPDPPREPTQSGRKFFIELLVALVIWGLQLIGVLVNLWLGGIVLVLVFGLIVRAFWIWEKATHWHIALRVGTVIVGAVFYFSPVVRQIINEWGREHSAKTEPAPNPNPDPESEMTYMDVSPYSKPGDPPLPSKPRLPLFQAGVQPQLSLFGKNTGSRLAEDAYPSSALEFHDSPFPIVPGKMMDKGPSLEIENEVWDQFKKDTKGLPVPKDTFPPGAGGWFTAAAFHPLSKIEAHQLRRGTKLMYVVGFIEWTDTAGTHEKRFCYLMEPPADTFLRSYVCQSHNEFLRKAVD
jgi:hypothetical protein